MNAVKHFARFFSALADENRLRLLHLMCNREICVCFLHGALKTNQPKISRHLAYLRRAELVEARRDGKWMHYSIKKQEPAFERLLGEALSATKDDPIIRNDLERARKIQCAPTRFGLSSPD